jgi:hypothetical protein
MARPRRGKLEGFQRINMIGFTGRLERFGRAKRARERDWRSVEEVVSTARVDVEDEEGPEVGKSVAGRLVIGGVLRVVGAESREKIGGPPGEPVITLHHVRSTESPYTLHKFEHAVLHCSA